MRSAEAAGGVFSCSLRQENPLEQTQRGLNWAQVLNQGLKVPSPAARTRKTLDLDPYGKGLLEALNKSSRWDFFFLIYSVFFSDFPAWGYGQTWAHFWWSPPLLTWNGFSLGKNLHNSTQNPRISLLVSLQLWRGIRGFPLLLSLKAAPKSKCFFPLLTHCWSRNFFPPSQRSFQDFRNFLSSQRCSTGIFLVIWEWQRAAAQDQNSWCSPRFYPSPISATEFEQIKSLDQTLESVVEFPLEPLGSWCFYRIFLCLSFYSAEQSWEEKIKVTELGLILKNAASQDGKFKNSLKPKPQELFNGSLLWRWFKKHHPSSF